MYSAHNKKLWVNEVQKQEENITGIAPYLFEKEQGLYDSCLIFTYLAAKAHLSLFPPFLRTGQKEFKGKIILT